MMKYKIHSNKQIWEEYSILEAKLRFLKGIVQNDGAIISEENLIEWQNETKSFLKEVSELSKKVKNNHIKKV